jgi:hypothetical protein
MSTSKNNHRKSFSFTQGVNIEHEFYIESFIKQRIRS